MADIFDDTEDFGFGGEVNQRKEQEEVLDDDVVDFQLSLKKKRKKKKKDKKKEEEKKVEEKTTGEAWEGTDRDYAYTELLGRVFKIIFEKNPTLAGQRRRHTVPPPQLARVGTRKTMWSNFDAICVHMHRRQDHVMNFFLSELGTEGNCDGTGKRLIMRGRYLPKQIESLLKAYINEYVTCHMCRNPETTLTRETLTRLYFVQCDACQARRSVQPIKTGFHAQSRAERRAARA